MHTQVIAFVLAGGRGTRLLPLTRHRAKPAVSFGGGYRIIDFVLSNFINSGICSIYVLTQFESQALLRHLRAGWQFSGLLKNQFIIPVPAQMRMGDERWYRGTADAIFRNIDLIEGVDDHLIAIFGADHVYRMDVRDMISFHMRSNAAVTVAAIPVPYRLAAGFGVLEVAADGAILGFHEKIADAPRMPSDCNCVYAPMGNYIFSARELARALQADDAQSDSRHDFGRDILPSLIGRLPMYAYDFRQNRIPGEGADSATYWRDVGTLEAYYEAQMDLCSLVPSLNLYNRRWPIRTSSQSDPGVKFSFDEQGVSGQALGSVISGGCIISGGRVQGSIMGRGIRIESGASVENAVILDNCLIGRRSRIRHAILDENVVVPDDVTVGYDVERDRERYHVTESGITVVSTSA
jgi:glucose-1-phosphate adenylyltransferase